MILFFIIIRGYVFTIIFAFILYGFRIMSGDVHFLTIISEGVRVAFKLLNHTVLTWYGTTPPLYPSTFPPFMTTASLTTPISPLIHYSHQVSFPSFNAFALHILPTYHYKLLIYFPIVYKVIVTFIHVDILVVYERLH